MADTLEQIVQRMIDADETEENIATVIRDYVPAKASAGMLPPSVAKVPGAEEISEGEMVRRAMIERGENPGFVLNTMGPFLEGIGERVTETGKGLMAFPGQVWNDPVGTAKNIVGGIIPGIAETGRSLISGDPRQTGRGVADVGMALTPGMSGKVTRPISRGAKATYGAAKRVAQNPAVRMAGGVALDMATLGRYGNLQQAQALARIARGLAPDAETVPARAAGAGPRARGGVILRDPELERTLRTEMEQKVNEAISGGKREPASSRRSTAATKRDLKAKEASPARAEGRTGAEKRTAETEFTKPKPPNPNAGGRLAPKPKFEETIAAQLESELGRELPYANRLPDDITNPADVSRMPLTPNRVERVEEILRQAEQATGKRLPNVPQTLEEAIAEIENAKINYPELEAQAGIERAQIKPPTPTPERAALDIERRAFEGQSAPINWGRVDAVPVDAMKRDLTQGGSIIEAGLSRAELGQRLNALKSLKPTKARQIEIERLERALRQRKHIERKAKAKK